MTLDARGGQEKREYMKEGNVNLGSWVTSLGGGRPLRFTTTSSCVEMLRRCGGWVLDFLGEKRAEEKWDLAETILHNIIIDTLNVVFCPSTESNQHSRR